MSNAAANDDIYERSDRVLRTAAGRRSEWRRSPLSELALEKRGWDVGGASGMRSPDSRKRRMTLPRVDERRRRNARGHVDSGADSPLISIGTGVVIPRARSQNFHDSFKPAVDFPYLCQFQTLLRPRGKLRPPKGLNEDIQRGR